MLGWASSSVLSCPEPSQRDREQEEQGLQPASWAMAQFIIAFVKPTTRVLQVEMEECVAIFGFLRPGSGPLISVSYEI